jgi:hypothetical protein
MRRDEPVGRDFVNGRTACGERDIRHEFRLIPPKDQPEFVKSRRARATPTSPDYEETKRIIPRLSSSSLRR